MLFDRDGGEGLVTVSGVGFPVGFFVVESVLLDCVAASGFAVGVDRDEDRFVLRSCAVKDFPGGVVHPLLLAAGDIRGGLGAMGSGEEGAGSVIEDVVIVESSLFLDVLTYCVFIGVEVPSVAVGVDVACDEV